MKIAIDIDDTLTNTREQQKKYWKEYTKKYPSSKYNNSLPININSFGDKYIDEFWDKYRYYLSFKCTFKKDASKYLNLLKQDGHDLCIVTSRPNTKYNNNLEKITIDWFKENNIPINKIYTDIKEKGKFINDNNIDLLIDDDYKHCKDTIKYGKKAIMFNNKKCDILNIDNWKDLYNYIKNDLN